MLPILLKALETFFAEVLIPILVNEAEKVFSRGIPNSGDLKYQWVEDAANAFIDSYLIPKLPQFLQGDADHLKRLIDEAIERAVAAL